MSVSKLSIRTGNRGKLARLNPKSNNEPTKTAKAHWLTFLSQFFTFNTNRNVKLEFGGQALFAQKCSQWETQSITTNYCFYISICVWIQQKTDWLTLELLVDVGHFLNFRLSQVCCSPCFKFLCEAKLIALSSSSVLFTLYLVLIFLYYAGKKINLPVPCYSNLLYYFRSVLAIVCFFCLFVCLFVFLMGMSCNAHWWRKNQQRVERPIVLQCLCVCKCVGLTFPGWMWSWCTP